MTPSRRIAIAAGMLLFAATHASQSIAIAPGRSSAPPTAPPGTQPINDVFRHYHDVGRLNLSVGNWGVLGDLNQASNVPAAQWPPGSDCEYLYGAGLWVGALYDHCEPIADFPNLDPARAIFCEGDSTRIVITDTLVTTALGYIASSPGITFETRPDAFDPVEIVYEAFEGRPGGGRGEDDDGDGSVDEDPQNGVNDDPLSDGRVDEDYAAISQQMFTSVARDTATFFNEIIVSPSEHHRPIGIEVAMDSYQYTAPTFDDFVGFEFRIRNIGQRSLRQVFVGFFVDSDVGCRASTSGVERQLDDRAGFIDLDTVLVVAGEDDEPLHIDVGYMRDEPGGDDQSDATGWFGTMFLGHTVDSTGLTAPDRVRIHAYKSWSNGEEDPVSDAERYNLLSGLRPGPFDQAIDVGSQRVDDWRQLLSAGPFFNDASTPFAPDCTLIFQSAFVVGDGEKGLIENAIAAQRIFNRPVVVLEDKDMNGTPDKLEGKKISPAALAQLAHWSGASAPPPPAQRLIPGDHRVTIEWDNFSERTPDALTGKDDFAGYQIWKAVGWRREAPLPRDELWFVIADVSKEELPRFDTGVTGIGKYRLVDTEVKNGFPYWYAVTAYDTAAIHGKYSQAAALVYPKWGPVSSVEDELIVPNEFAPGAVTSAGPFLTLDNVHVAPNPYKERADWDLEKATGDATGRRIYFLNLPERATIRIFSLTGDLLQTIEHEWTAGNTSPDDPNAGTFWNLVTRNNQEVTSGIYIYQVDSPVGAKVGKFAVIR
jgi:hypothetical protein